MPEYIITAGNKVVCRGYAQDEIDLPTPKAGETLELVESGDSRRPEGLPPPTYVEHRRMSYPPIGDQLDAIWKALAVLDWQAWPVEVTNMMGKVAEVKTKFPKKL